MQQSILSDEINDEHMINLDMVGNDEVLLPACSTHEIMSTTENERVAWEMINAGLQKAHTEYQDYGSAVWSIYKVEQNLKNVHGESTFHPKIVSIGPFHHKKSDHLKPMEYHKWRFLYIFLMRMRNHHSHLQDGETSGTSNYDKEDTTSDRRSINPTSTITDDTTINHTKKIQYLAAAMEKLEAVTRACYSERFDDLGSKEFVQMMVLDGCFIIQLLLLFHETGGSCRSYVDPIYTWRSTLPYLRHDLLLLENQLPFNVLHNIFVISGIDRERCKFTDLIINFFNPVLFREKEVLDACKKQVISNKNYWYQHLLHLFMSSFQTRKNDKLTIKKKRKTKENLLSMGYFPGHIPNDGRDQDMSIHCVTSLREAGIEFKKRDHHGLLDVEFKGGILYIPTLLIDETTVPVLLNFIAYEQRCQNIETSFTSYLMFLDYLVNSSKDVEHLHYKGIINHGLGSDEEVATLFNKLCKEVVQDLGDWNYLSQVFKDVNKYFGKRRNRWRAAWKHEYFRNPWAFTSFLAAIVLIVLTFLQTFCSMYTYFNPSS